MIGNKQWRAGKRETRVPAAFRKCALAGSSTVIVVDIGRVGSLKNQALYMDPGAPEPSSCSWHITILLEADMGQSRAGLMEVEGWVLMSKKQRFWRGSARPCVLTVNSGPQRLGTNHGNMSGFGLEIMPGRIAN